MNFIIELLNFMGPILNLDNHIILDTFPNRVNAEMAAGLLESEGVPALVLADDACGAYPSLQFTRGVCLLVIQDGQRSP